MVVFYSFLSECSGYLLLVLMWTSKAPEPLGLAYQFCPFMLLWVRVCVLYVPDSELQRLEYAFAFIYAAFQE